MNILNHMNMLNHTSLNHSNILNHRNILNQLPSNYRAADVLRLVFLTTLC